MVARAKFSDSAVYVNGVAYQVVPNATVTLYNKGTTTPLSVPIYAAITGGTTKPNPFTADANGTIEFWLDDPDRVKIVTTGISGGTPVGLTADYVPVLPDPADMALWGGNFFNLAKTALPWTAPSAGLTSLVARPDGGMGWIPSGGPARFAYDSVDWNVVNVKHHATVQAAYDSTGPTTPTALLFPPGTYSIELVADDFKALSILGAGPGVTTITPSHASNPAITVNAGPILFSMRDLAITSSATRGATTYLVSIIAAFTVKVTNVYAYAASRGRVFNLESCGKAFISDSELYSHTGGTEVNGSNGDCVYHAVNTATLATNTIFQTGQSSFGSSPTVWLEGGNSHNFSNNIFGGGGPVKTLTLSGITDSGPSFVVFTSTAHGLRFDDLIVIRGCGGGGAPYNSEWRVASVGSTVSFTVTATTTAGNYTAVGGETVETLTAAFYVDGVTHAANESTISNCLASRVASGGTAYGSVGFYLDGRTGLNTITGWELDNVWGDAGSTGILIAGRTTGSGGNTTYGFTINNPIFAMANRSIQLDQVVGVTISNMLGGLAQATDAADGVSAMCALYIYGGAIAPAATGITVTNSHLGRQRDFGLTPTWLPTTYAVVLDGPVDFLSIQGCQLDGQVGLIVALNGALTDARTWKIKDNLSPITAPAVASATSMNLVTGYDTFTITGTTSISTITGGWKERTVALLFQSALSLVTGGNLAIGATRAVLTGQRVELTFNGTSWYVG